MKKLFFLVVIFTHIIQISVAQNNFPISGNVGVGIASPSVPLDVMGTVKIQSSNNNYGENLRLLPSLLNDYSSIAFGAVTGNSGTGIGQWTLIRYPASSNYMFSLRYNSTDFFNILNNGNVGIGTSTPGAKLDVRGIIKSFEPIGLGSPVSSALLINEVGARAGTENSIYQRLWLYRDNASSSNWWTTRFHDGISIDVSFGSPQVDTRTWWERDPNDNIQSWGNAAETYVTINKGNVGIGTTNPTSKLTVAGNIHSREVKVTVDAGADFVFEKEYNLPSLDSVDNYIKENKHLPEIASAAEMKKDGINLSEMNIKLLQKVEELTLYMIEQNKKMELQQKENAIQSKQIEEQNIKILSLQKMINNLK